MENKLILTEGKVFRLLAYDSNLSVEEIAQSLGVTRQYLSRMFNMERLPRKQRKAAADLLGVAEDDFDQMTLKDQIESLQKDVKILRAENEMLKAKVGEHEARIKALEAENAYLKVKYN